jgi:putative copper resistance protein D
LTALPPWFTAIGLAARWLDLSACVLLVGVFADLLASGRSDRPTVLSWEARMLRWACVLAAVAVGAGLIALAYQTAVLVGAPSAALDGASLLRVLLDTQSGRIWLARHGVLLLLTAFLLLRADVTRPLDWTAARAQGLLLGGAALGLVGLAGHAAAGTPGGTRAIVVDIAHLAGVGVWAGALAPLATLLVLASRDSGADARPYAVLSARRFSRRAVVAIVVIVLSGMVTTVDQVGGVPALVGTRYGHLLLVKLALFLPILALGALNRTHLVPALSGEAVTVGRPAMRRLARFVSIEALLALGMLAVVTGLNVTPPARHEQPAWPFSFRLAPSTVADTPARTVALVGSQLLVLGIVAAVAAALMRARRLPLLGVAFLLVGIGAGLALPPITVDAYPTTYRRPDVAYTASSIAAGRVLYADHCARCHGRDGRGDGPAGAGLPRPPADLRAAHTAHHTAGDLYWWITNGIAAAGMPEFGTRIGNEERWDVVNAVRALAEAEAARTLRGAIDPGRARIVAPDFIYAVGPTAAHTLREHRERRIVVLVIYSLPGSRPRLAELAVAYPTLSTLGVEVIAVPVDAAPDAIRALALPTPALFPVVTEGAADIVHTYALFGTAPHTEFLVDRQGYLRARWLSDGTLPTVNTVLAEIQELNAEKVVAPLPAEHVH